MKGSLVYAVILSGGSGNRFGNDLPKQFAEVYGRTILDYCITNFNNHTLVDKIIVVSNPEHIQRTKQIASTTKFKKIISIVEGGLTRGESSYIGLKEILNHESNVDNIKVLIQDSVRPNTNSELIEKVVEKLDDHNAVTIAVPTTDTIYIAGENNYIQNIPDRNKLFKAQTPQGFNFNIIFPAYEKLEKVSRFKQTDDVGVVNMVFPDEDIVILEGDKKNIKVTFSEDLEFFRQVLQTKSSTN